MAKPTKPPKRRNIHGLLIKSRPGGPMHNRTQRSRQVPRKGKHGDGAVRQEKE
jgi:hypothetical protein